MDVGIFVALVANVSLVSYVSQVNILQHSDL
jgi:hypothetical protein